MKTNLKLLISSAFVALTFSMPREALGMEDASTNLAQNTPVPPSLPQRQLKLAVVHKSIG